MEHQSGFYLHNHIATLPEAKSLNLSILSQQTPGEGRPLISQFTGTLNDETSVPYISEADLLPQIDFYALYVTAGVHSCPPYLSPETGRSQTQPGSVVSVPGPTRTVRRTTLCPSPRVPSP